MNTAGTIHKKVAREHRQLLKQRFLSNKLAVIGSVIIVIATLVSLFAPFISPYDPQGMEPVQRYAAPSMAHWMGTDNFGRDILSRVIHGVQVSMWIGFNVTFWSCLVGLIVGLYSAYYKKLDMILMRITDGLMSFPAILLAVAITAALGPSKQNIMISLSVVFAPHVSRIVRSVALEIKEQTFIEALKALGAENWRVIWFHIAPNVVAPLVIQASFSFSISIVSEASLSFLGVGIPAPEPSLGNILFEGKYVLESAWWMTVFPGITFVFLILGLNLLGDGFRDVLDPHAK